MSVASTQRVKLGDILTLINGRAYKQEELLTSGTPVIRIQNLNGGDRWFYSDLSLPEEKYCESGDLLFAWSATFGPYLWNGPKSIFHYHIWKVLPSQNLDKGYAYHMLQSITARVKAAGRGISMIHMTKAGMEAWEVDLPPLDEQKRIAAILDKADALRAKRRQAIALLDSLTQSIFLEMFEQGNLGWPNIELKDAVKQGTIVTYGIVQAGEEFEGGVPYIRTGDIQGGEIVCEHLRHTAPQIAVKFSRSRVEAGDIVMSIRATVGTTALVPAELEGANLTQGTARIAPGADLEADYLLYYLRSDPVQAWIQRQVKGATFREITLARLRELNVVVPPIDLQREFTAAMRKIRHMKSKLTDAIAASDTLFTSLQHRAFTGQL